MSNLHCILKVMVFGSIVKLASYSLNCLGMRLQTVFCYHCCVEAEWSVFLMQLFFCLCLLSYWDMTLIWFNWRLLQSLDGYPRQFCNHHAIGRVFGHRCDLLVPLFWESQQTKLIPSQCKSCSDLLACLCQCGRGGCCEVREIGENRLSVCAHRHKNTRASL